MYLMRLDDASEYMDWNKWNRMHDLLNKYHIKPIVAIIPHNENKDMIKKYCISETYNFWETMLEWIKEGWTPSLHGYNHVLDSMSGGINPVNQRSEFAGIDLNKQKQKIADGYKILCEHGIVPRIFVAPAHTFDENTIIALREATDIRIISDTVGNDTYKRDDFYYIPQQCGMVRKLPFKTVTFCYHPNTLTEKQFEELELFLRKNSKCFTSFEQLKLSEKGMSIFDRFLHFLYFAKR